MLRNRWQNVALLVVGAGTPYEHIMMPVAESEMAE